MKKESRGSLERSWAPVHSEVKRKRNGAMKGPYDLYGVIKYEEANDHRRKKSIAAETLATT